MSGVYLTGLASGLDTDSIVSALVSAEGLGRQRIEMQQAAANARRTNLSDIATKMKSLKLAVGDLKSVATWVDTQAVESADSTKLTATRTSGAGPGAYEVKVTQLAAGARRSYDWQGAASPLVVAGKDGSTRATITLDPAGTLDDAVAAINSNGDANLYAVNVNGSLVLASRDTGTGSDFSVTGAGGLTASTDGQNALGSVDGVPFDEATNTLKTAIPGLTVALKGKTDSTMVTVGGPQPDLDVVTAKMKAFVDAYNAVVTATRADLTEKRVTDVSSTADAAKGSLFGDQGLNGMLSALRQTVSTQITGLTGVSSFAELGISTGNAGAAVSSTSDAVQGKLTFDAAKFKAAIAADPRGVQKALGGVTGKDGLSQALDGVITPYTTAGGMLDDRVSSVDSDLTRIKANLTKFDDRLADREAYYKKMYASLETALANSKSVQTDLAARLAAM